uniref:Reverse transcriptase domain-containing protein n=1 Tax=Tanacetum cinerariifolium TaxID=118510 RepID=A0A6L2KDB8_TANCI|nr:reverse transcriptase domain-containing protein [Tanacetum cinerariifolium]
MKIQAGVQGSRPKELRRHLQLWKCFRRHYYVVIVLVRNITFSTLRKINMKLNPKKCLFKMEEGKFLGYVVTFERIRGNLEKTKAVMDMPSSRTLKQMQFLSEKMSTLDCFLSKSIERSLPFLNTLKKYTNKKDFRWIEAFEAAFLEMKKLVSELPTRTTPKKGKTLMMYLATADEAVNAVLLTERDIHHVSRSLQGEETNYAPMEKLTLGLVHAAMRLRRYFQAYPIKVITNIPIKQVLSNSKASGTLLEDPVDARTLMEKIRNYTLEDGVLYRKYYLVPLMRCVRPLQANYVIREVHIGSCEMHDGPRQVMAKAMNLGYYCPSMRIDAKELIRACDDCQAHASVPKISKADMISVTSAWPFMK